MPKTNTKTKGKPTRKGVGKPRSRTPKTAEDLVEGWDRTKRIRDEALRELVSIAEQNPGPKLYSVGDVGEMLTKLQAFLDCYREDGFLCGDLGIFIYNEGTDREVGEATLGLIPIAVRIMARFSDSERIAATRELEKSESKSAKRN